MARRSPAASIQHAAGRGARSRGLTIDAMGALALAALITFLSAISVMLLIVAADPNWAALFPTLAAALLASALILFQQWFKTRQTAEAGHTRMAYLLEHDEQTRFLNRRGFLRALELQGETTGQGALVCISLTRLGEIIDTQGEVTGQQVSEEIGRRLGSAFQGAGALGRISEDMFAVFYRATGAERLSLLSGRINQLVNHPVETITGRVHAGCALGVCFVPTPLADPAEALRQARLALAAARSAGAAIAVFDDGMDASRGVRLSLERDLREAVAAGQLDMAYQPQINEKGALIGVEALIRWSHPTRGDIPPTVFIPIAEACGLADVVGRFSLDRAFRDSHRWPGLKVAVNVSPVQLRVAGFLEALRELVAAHGVTPSRIELEITEGVLLENNPTVTANLEGARKMGFQLALDDFGVGYSGFGYLNQFRVDKIKIDRSFVSPLGARSDAAPIIRAISDMSEAIGVKVLAEGVETRQQLDALREEGCKQAQGFYIGRPTSADQIDALLAPEESARQAA